MKLRFFIFGLVGVAAAWLGFAAFSPAGAVEVFTRIGYPSVLLSFGLFGYYVFKSLDWRASWSDFRVGGWRVSLLVVLLSGFLHLKADHHFKIVMDEVMLSATAQGMHRERAPVYAERAVETGMAFQVLDTRVDKRPLFFPLLLSLVHDVSGYRPTNVFWLNGLLTPFFFGLLYAVTRRLAGAPAALAATLMWATIPLFALCVTGGGFELLNLVMIVATVWLGMRYADAPDSDRLAAFVLSGVLLAQTRYESVLLLAPVAVIIAWVAWRHRRVELPWPAVIAPLLLVVYPLQHNLFKISPEFWQLGDQPGEHGVFSVLYFGRNLGHALNHFFTFDFSQPSSALVALAGLAGLGLFPVWLLCQWREAGSRDVAKSVAVVFTLALVALGGVLMCYFWGRFDHWVTARLSLPLQLAFVWLFVMCVTDLGRASATFWRGLSVVAVCVLMLWTVPLLNKGRYGGGATTPQVVRWEMDFIRRHDLRGTLVIDPRTTHVWMLHEVMATSTPEVMARPSQWLFHHARRTFDQVLVVQRLRSTGPLNRDWEVLPGDDLGPGVEFEPVERMVLSPFLQVRICRVRTVDRDGLLAFASDYLRRGAQREDNRAAMLSPQQYLYRTLWFESVP